MKTHRRWTPYVVVAVVALFGVLATLAIARVPDRSGSRWELAIAHYGYPLWFVEAELTSSRASGPNPAVRLNPWEHPTRTAYSRLLASWLMIAALPFGAVWWYERRIGSQKTIRRKSKA